MRSIIKPAWLSDFIATADMPPQFSYAHLNYVFNISIDHEPVSYKQAQNDLKWKEAMQQEITALETNQTWEIVLTPTHKKPIASKWVFKLKRKLDETIDQYKARLVAKGFKQLEGINYTESFFPIAKLVTIRLFLAIAASHSWPVHQMDINNAYLHGFIDDELYILPPEGYTKATPSQVCKLRKALYGLKQVGHQWNKEFTSKLLSFGFHQSPYDHCLFTKGSGSHFQALIFYIDDMLLTSEDESNLLATKTFLDKMFTIKDLGYAKFFLGLEIARSHFDMFLN